MMDYADRVDALAHEYESRIMVVLEGVREVFVAAGWSSSDDDPPHHVITDEHLWRLVFLPPGVTWGPGEDCPDEAVDVTFEISEQWASEGDGEGVTFRIDVVRYSGEILGGLAPGNYTEACWLSLDDPGAIEDRFQIFERADPREVLALVRRGA